MATTDDPKYVVTGEVRLSYPNLFKPRKRDEDKDPQYSALLLIPKSDTKTVKAIKEAQKAAAIEKGGKVQAGKTIPSGWKNTLRDGDEERDTEEQPEYADHYFLNVSANEGFPPGVVDRRLQPIMDQSEIYAGCYVHAAINAFGYDATKAGGGKGVSFGLRHIQFRRDGEPLAGGGEKAEDVFTALDSEDEEGDDSGLL